jgi:hypothetical protein
MRVRISPPWLNRNEMEIGKRISPVLESIEDALWEWDFNGTNGKPGYTDGGFRSAVKIFMSVMMDRMWDLQQDESIDMNDRVAMVEKCGNDVRNLIKTYTNIDTHNLYKNEQ